MIEATATAVYACIGALAGILLAKLTMVVTERIIERIAPEEDAGERPQPRS